MRHNQLSGESYDLSGNMLNSPMGGEGLTYDAENRIVAVGPNINYMYDGDGNRVLKDVAGAKTVYFRNAATLGPACLRQVSSVQAGEMHQEFTDSGSGYVSDRNHLMFAGERWAVWITSENKLKVNFNDDLGSCLA